MVLETCSAIIVVKMVTLNVIVLKCSVSKVVTTSSLVVKIMVENMPTLLVWMCLSNLRSSRLILVASSQVVVFSSSQLI